MKNSKIHNIPIKFINVLFDLLGDSPYNVNCSFNKRRDLQVEENQKNENNQKNNNSNNKPNGNVYRNLFIALVMAAIGLVLFKHLTAIHLQQKK